MTADPSVAPAPPTWESALQRLEDDVSRLEALEPGAAAPEVEEWEPPTDLGPLPHDLAPRARDLLSRQLFAVGRLTAALSGNRQQARVADSVRAATVVTGRAAYVDVRA
ncbi:hypothetical protein [Nocardioides stalactiti]|uniref:hypothetical protein n=1 Tax=Nocardioides stalactiti TaxID=2755356 RepID=UPI0015FFA5CE|nr:hypothetical protein [Nocardioides stalactiti]